METDEGGISAIRDGQDIALGLQLAPPAVIDAEAPEGGVIGTWSGVGLAITRATWTFGGMTAAQAMVAATASAPGRVVRSFTTRFLRQGKPGRPTQHEVTRVLDSGSFSDRRVRTSIDGSAIAETSVILHRPDTTELGHQHPMPGVPPPEGRDVVVGAGFETIDLNEPPLLSLRASDAAMRLWMRIPDTPRDDDLRNRCALAICSDVFPASSAWRPVAGHTISQVGTVVSFGLQFSVVFHGPCEMADWHLIDIDSPAAADGRALVQAHWFTRDGRLVATVTLDSVMRLRLPTPETAGI